MGFSQSIDKKQQEVVFSSKYLSSKINIIITIYKYLLHARAFPRKYFQFGNFKGRNYQLFTLRHQLGSYEMCGCDLDYVDCLRF